ncbi:MAG: hypothetical protein IJX88_00525 [Clostridia bacterium]|nr:hypothetical protein [Clostridia bacterium]
MKRRILSICLAFISVFGAVACGKKSEESSSSVATGPIVMSISLEKTPDPAPKGMDKTQFTEWLLDNDITLRVAYDTHRENETITGGLLQEFVAKETYYQIRIDFGGKTLYKQIPYFTVDNETYAALKKTYDQFTLSEETGVLSNITEKEAAFASFKEAYNAMLAYTGAVTSKTARTQTHMSNEGKLVTASTETELSYEPALREYYKRAYTVDGTEKTLTQAEKMFHLQDGGYYHYVYGQDETGKDTERYTIGHEYLEIPPAKTTYYKEIAENFYIDGIFLANGADELRTAYETVYENSAKYGEGKAQIRYKQDELILFETLQYKSGIYGTVSEKTERRIVFKDGKISTLQFKRIALREDGWYQSDLFTQTFSYEFDTVGHNDFAMLVPIKLEKDPYVKTLGFEIADGAFIYGTAESTEADPAALFEEIVQNAFIDNAVGDPLDYTWNVSMHRMRTADGNSFDVATISAEDFMKIDKLYTDNFFDAYHQNSEWEENTALFLLTSVDWQLTKNYEIVFGRAKQTDTSCTLHYLETQEKWYQSYAGDGYVYCAEYYVEPGRYYCGILTKNGETYKLEAGKKNYIQAKKVFGDETVNPFSRYVK